MSLREARAQLIAALRDGRFEHEARSVVQEKNLLAIGEVDAEYIVLLLLRTRGDQYEEAPHHWDPTVTVHVFKPEVDGERWYVKAYFLDADDGRAVFMSVHG